MSHHRLQLALRSAVIFGGVLLVAGAVALAFYSPARPVARVGHPQGSSQPTTTTTPAATANPATNSPEASANPVVAGAATTAPHAASTKPAASTPTPVPPVTNAVTLQLIDPAGTFTYGVHLLAGADACTILTEAKSEGDLASVTIDNSYLSTLHSAYVREINGFENNWTVKVNGIAPQGCSLVSLKNNDNVTWRFN